MLVIRCAAALVLNVLLFCAVGQAQGTECSQEVINFWEDANPSRDTLRLTIGLQLKSCPIVLVMRASPTNDTVFYELEFGCGMEGPKNICDLFDTVKAVASVGASCCFVDLNCDGFLDVRLEEERGDHWRRLFHNWLFNSRRGGFVRNTTYDEIPDDIEIDTISKTITNMRGTPRDFTQVIHRIVNGDAVLYQVTHTGEWEEGGKLHWTKHVERWENGKCTVEESSGQDEL
jgi:hypothetical protein